MLEEAGLAGNGRMIDWDRVVTEHGPMVWRTTYRLLGRADEAEDCLQETFLAAVEFARRQRVKSWPGLLRHLATARALDRLRRRRPERVESADPDAIAGNQADPAELAEAAELGERLRGALTRLSPRQAEVFSLRFMEEMSYREIGAALGLRTNAVAVLLHEAREKLRAALMDGEM